MSYDHELIAEEIREGVSMIRIHGAHRVPHILRTLHALHEQSEAMRKVLIAPVPPTVEGKIEDWARQMVWPWKPHHICTVHVTPEQADHIEGLPNRAGAHARERHQRMMSELLEEL